MSRCVNVKPPAIASAGTARVRSARPRSEAIMTGRRGRRSAMLEVIAAPTVPAMWPTAPSVATLYGVAPKVAIAAKSMADFPTSDPNWEMHWPDQSKRKSRWRHRDGSGVVG